MHQALKTNGIIYTSFKYGTFEGELNGRYFTDFTEGMFEEFVRKISGLQIEKMWITGDVREGRGDERWLNILLPDETVLVVFEWDSLNLTVYNPSKEIQALMQKIACSEGLFWRK